MSTCDVIVLGGGAAGFFAAISSAEKNPSLRILLLERTERLLSKVLISGGGRCNVTHACYEPAQLVTSYPRGAKALLGAFHRFQPRQTVEWFESHGVELKTEDDGRIFPTTDTSRTIADCLIKEAGKARIRLQTQAIVRSIVKEADEFKLTFQSEETMTTPRLVLATGSNSFGWEWASALGHTIETPVPSLFTFKIDDPRLKGLSGLSVPKAAVDIEGLSLQQTGPLLITHWGFSGPATLKLSAWAARELHQRNYQATLRVNWLADIKPEILKKNLEAYRFSQAKKVVSGDNTLGIPKRLWARLVETVGIPADLKWTNLSSERLTKLVTELSDGHYAITGKGVFKEEFVTCGGVRLDEVDFRTMQSKRCPGLYLAGEILDVDGLTGGFNFQNAWTTGWIAGQAAATSDLRRNT